MRHDLADTIEYKGFNIEVIRDESPQNPFEDWDGEPPLAVYSDRNITEYATQYGHVNEVPTLTREQIKANLPAILEMLDMKSAFALREHYDSWNYSLEDIVHELLTDHVNNANNSDRLELLCELYNMAGQPAIVRSSRGYSQGDWAEVLAVATPEFIKATGAPETEEMLEGAIKLWGYWAWGDVYGFNIPELEDEMGSSVWGYYGDDPESGLLEAAKSHIDWYRHFTA